ncbi:hypothetical protein RHSP_57688 [Rhizobium freirei PRF 81]|uniref:Uncharacterized protein n=1 Tax=Rhizobium freirei PRF 81 TaxID=363754 RepID=N6TXA9_9HYPH|nr:hypothetical protein RHSP_57688 [Rhizobium freirei PRF 81]
MQGEFVADAWPHYENGLRPIFRPRSSRFIDFLIYITRLQESRSINRRDNSIVILPRPSRGSANDGRGSCRSAKIDVGAMRLGPRQGSLHRRDKQVRRQPRLRQSERQTQPLQSLGPDRLFRFAASRERHQNGAAAGNEEVADGIVARLGNRQLRPSQQGREILAESDELDIARRIRGEIGKILLRQVRPGHQQPAAVDRHAACRLERRADEIAADGATAGRDDDIEGLLRLRRQRRRDKPGVDDLVGDGCGQGKSLFQPDEMRIAVNENTIEVIAKQPHGLLVPARLLLLLQNIAYRRIEPRLAIGLGNGIEQGQQLKAHLPPPEGKGFNDDDVRLGLPKRFEQKLAAARQKRLVDRVAGLVGKSGKAGAAGDHRRQRDGGHVAARKAIHGNATGDDRHLAAVLRHGAGDAAGPRQMADAEQMLNVEEYAQGVGTCDRHADFRH